MAVVKSPMIRVSVLTAHPCLDFYSISRFVGFSSALLLGRSRCTGHLAPPPAHGLAWVAEPTRQTYLNDFWYTSPTSDFTALIDN